MARASLLGLCLTLVSMVVTSPWVEVGAAPRADSGEASLGHIDFPVTGPTSARRHFVRGMLALHSFWYEEAAEEFRAATAAAPDFAMGYWGEALTSYHPVWAQEDLAASRAALARLPAKPRVDARERAFIDAARVLFGDGDRTTRWRRYAEAMGDIYRSRPRDDEAATLYAVALLGAAIGERQLDGRPTTFLPFAQAGAIALSVMERNPRHPGAAHYAIHAFDDPEHAILALPAARRYASIAPAAYHAQHMPSHIFVQLGMWPEAAASNEAAWKASESWVRRKHLDSSYLDFHSLAWLMSIHLEVGQGRRAGEVLGRARDALARSRDPGRLPLIYSYMAGEYLLQTGQWGRMDDLLAPLVAFVDAPPATALAPPGAAASSSAVVPTCHPAAERATRASLEARALLAFLRGEAAYARQDATAVTDQAVALSQLPAAEDLAIRNLVQVRELELRAAAAELKGKIEDAVTDLRGAIAIDERTPPAGPAGDATPRERLGELFQRRGRPGDALPEFVRTVALHPGRTRALLGAARAAGATGADGAQRWWTQLAALWADADPDTAGLDQARRAAASRTSP